ncbi:MAG: type I pullulanase [Clostridiales bacterium]|nr:type I pullulanase [Clostridiales bacterium]
MKKLIKAGEKLKQLFMLVLAAAVAILAMPIGLIGSSHGAFAEAVTGEHNGSTPGVMPSATGDSYTLTVNYYRQAADYEGWNLWAWSNGVGGKRYDFSSVVINSKPWLTLTLTLDNVDVVEEKVIGIICRLSTPSNEWEKKAVENDIWVPLSYFDEENKAEVFLADNLEELYTNPEDAMAHKTIRKITGATFRSFTTLRAMFNSAVTDKSVFVVKNSADEVLITLVPTVGDEKLNTKKNFKPGSTYIDFDLGKEFVMDFGDTYTVYDEPTDEFDPEYNYPSKAAIAYSLFDTDEFNERFEYTGTLGAEYSAAQTKFTVWSPVAASISVVLYAAGEGGEPTGEHPMTKGEKGEWTATVTGDLDKTYYTYKVTDNKGNVKEVVDPYAKSAGRNGKRGMVLNLNSTNPTGWANHHKPDARGSYSNAIIYEAHIRDLTMDENSNVSAEHKGKFLGLTEKASAANGNKMTPLDYIKDLGITEIHILPMFDINSVDEYDGNAEYDANGQFNWGYDPLNYNVPEGSYSTDPTKGEVRVNELKQMIMALHAADIRVIMDVVYNHVADVEGSNFQALVPGYYFRTNSDGSWKKASGCGNDTASERAMYRKFMIDSVNHWAREYQIDGFRFDLMGLHDHVTMNAIYDSLAEYNPDIMIYGEGWEMGSLVETPTVKAANMYNASRMPNIAFFDDATRDTIKGGGFGQSITAKGFISGSNVDAAIYMGAAGGTAIPAGSFGYAGKRSFAANPTQNVNYVSCHDNSTLWDKINASTPGVSNDVRKAMNRLAAAAVLTSQGPAFFLAGEEMLRSKPTTKDNTFDNRPEKWADSDQYFADNSYKSPDSVNAMKWELAETNADMVNFYKQLIALKKNSPMFRIATKAQLGDCLVVADANMTDGLTAYAVKDPKSDEYAVVLFNSTAKETTMKVPNGEYKVYVNGAEANGTTPLSTFTGSKFKVGAYSAVVMKAELNEDKITAWEEAVKSGDTDSDTPDGDDNLGLALGLGIGIPAAVLVAGGAVFGVMYGKKKKGKGGNAETDSAPEPEVPDDPESKDSVKGDETTDNE